jgi:hypothetical protein
MEIRPSKGSEISKERETMNWLLRLLPVDTRNMIKLGVRMFGALDTAEERRAVLAYALTMFDPDGPGGGRVTGPEFMTLGGKLKIMRAPKAS